MTFGISIQNTSNSVIISEEYSNYSKVASGTYPNGSQPNFGNAGDDLVFVKPSSIGSSLYCINAASTPLPVVSSSGYVDWVLMRRGISSGNRYGAKIFRSDGSVAFDFSSSPVYPVMQVDFTYDSSSYNIPNDLTMYIPYGSPPNRSRYILINSINAVGFANNDVYRSLLMSKYVEFTNNTMFRFTIGVIDSSGPPGVEVYWGSPSVLICDI
jgi:hypothetical protein